MRDAAHVLGIFLISSFSCCTVLFGGSFGESGHWGKLENTPTLSASVRMHPQDECVSPVGICLLWLFLGNDIFLSVWMH